jgi:hypothetical protein
MPDVPLDVADAMTCVSFVPATVEKAGVEFIDENGAGPSVRRRARTNKASNAK